MSIGSEIRDERPLGDLAGARAISFSSHLIPYILTTADGVSILLASLAGGIGYQLVAGYEILSIGPYIAVGLLASIIHIFQMSGKGYYGFPDCAKPRVETNDILIC